MQATGRAETELFNPGQASLGYTFAVTLVAACLFLVAYGSRNNDYLSDPRLNLVTAQAIIDHGTVALDLYKEEGIQGYSFDWYLSRGEMISIDGHYYDYFPVGPAILSVPAVWVAKMHGFDMRTPANFAVQRVLSATSVSLVFVLLYLLVRSRLGRRDSLILAGAFTCGSTILSTMGSALWSINYTTVIAAGGLNMLAHSRGTTLSWHTSILVGLLLFLAYFTRASAAVFVLSVLLYILFRHRPAFPYVALTSGILLFLFAVWSRHTYGLWLPPYYLPTRLANDARAPFWQGLLGHVASPSRGILVFSPFVILPMTALLLRPRVALRDPLARACLLWATLHIVISSQGVQWWGGWSFGPRLLTEIVPGLLLLTASAWKDLRAYLSQTTKRLVTGAFLVLSGLAAVIHGPQGLYNPAIARWNALVYPVPPASSEGLGDLFDWRYSQAFASDAVNCRIEHDHGWFLLPLDRTLSPYAWNTPITYAADLNSDWRGLARSAQARSVVEPLPSSHLAHRILLPLVANGSGAQVEQNDALFIGFQLLNRSHLEIMSTRSTICSESAVVIGPIQDMPAQQGAVLRLTVSAMRTQTVAVTVNEVLVGENTVGQPGHAQPETLTFDIPAGVLHKWQPNTIGVSLPSSPDDRWFTDLLEPGPPDGIALHELRLTPSAADRATPDAGSAQAAPQ